MTTVFDAADLFAKFDRSEPETFFHHVWILVGDYTDARYRYNQLPTLHADWGKSAAQLKDEYALSREPAKPNWLFVQPDLSEGSWTYWLGREESKREEQRAALRKGDDYRVGLNNLLDRYSDPKNLPNMIVLTDGRFANSGEIEDHGFGRGVVVGGNYHGKSVAVESHKYGNGDWVQLVTVGHATDYETETDFTVIQAMRLENRKPHYAAVRYIRREAAGDHRNPNIHADWSTEWSLVRGLALLHVYTKDNER